MVPARGADIERLLDLVVAPCMPGTARKPLGENRATRE